VFAAQGQSLYQQQQEIFADIKKRNGQLGNGVKTVFGQSLKNFRQEEKENLLLSSIQQISIDSQVRK